MNAKKKGDVTEREATKLFSEIWKYDHVCPAQRTMKPFRRFEKGKWVVRYKSQANDFYGLFDLMAIHDRLKYWVQVKYGNCNISHAKTKIRAFYLAHLNKGDIVVVLERVPRKGWIWHEYDNFVEDTWIKAYHDLKGESVAPWD